MTEYLRHNKIALAFHTLRTGGRPALLLLHGLAEASPEQLPAECKTWPGAVYALDFTGHGKSTLPKGGGYTAEQLMGDADAALARLGTATLCGRGLGAYVALLLAGARPRAVRGAILCDGPGFVGGGSQPGTPLVVSVEARLSGPPDPLALFELARDIRPPDYAANFVRQATQLSGLPCPLAVCARERSPWLQAVIAEPGVLVTTLRDALELFT